MSYTYTEVTSLDDWNETAWTRCLTESWASLQTSMDWSAFLSTRIGIESGDTSVTVNHADYTDAQKQNHLWQYVRNGVTGQDSMVMYLLKDAHIVHIILCTIDRDETNGNTLSINFFIAGRDADGNKGYIESDVITQRKAFRAFVRQEAYNIKNVEIKLCNVANAHAMANHYTRHYKNASSVQSYDERTTEYGGSTRTMGMTKHVLPTDDSDLEG